MIAREALSFSPTLGITESQKGVSLKTMSASEAFTRGVGGGGGAGAGALFDLRGSKLIMAIWARVFLVTPPNFKASLQGRENGSHHFDSPMF